MHPFIPFVFLWKTVQFKSKLPHKINASRNSLTEYEEVDKRNKKQVQNLHATKLKKTIRFYSKTQNAYTFREKKGVSKRLLEPN